jgi:site-specific DNA-methyltransferase (adenine-specific)
MRKEQFGKVTIYQGDCMELMAGLDDKAFDLAVVDPPYGIGMSGGNVGYKGNNNLERKGWDLEIPKPEYFSQIKRVSNNQIIWGGNYFPGIWPSRCYLVWDKGAGFKGRTYAESELAYTSFDQNAKTFSYDPLANRAYSGKIHPTQKTRQTLRLDSVELRKARASHLRYASW